jgi:hypothetical protein
LTWALFDLELHPGTGGFCVCTRTYAQSMRIRTQVQAGGTHCRFASGGVLKGLMQEPPLVVSGLLDYAVKVHGEREIVSRTIEDPSKVHRYLPCGLLDFLSACCLAPSSLKVLAARLPS